MVLVLTRGADEGFYIGDDIHVRVLSVKGKRVRLGIEASSELRILRDEIKPDKERVISVLMDKVEQ